MIKTRIRKIEDTPPLKVTNKKKHCFTKSPFECPICGEVWQPKNGNEGKERLDDFPKIGCSPNICPGCSEVH